MGLQDMSTTKPTTKKAFKHAKQDEEQRSKKQPGFGGSLVMETGQWRVRDRWEKRYPRLEIRGNFADNIKRISPGLSGVCQQKVSW